MYRPSSKIWNGAVIKGVHAIQNFTHSDERPTLGFMKPQGRVLDVKALYKPLGFSQIFRNF